MTEISNVICFSKSKYYFSVTHYNIQMRKEYDFSQSQQTLYAKKIKKKISLNLNVETIEYFKVLSSKTGIPSQTLMNSYLSDCVYNQLQPPMKSLYE